MPPPMLTASLTLKDTAGLMLNLSPSHWITWERPDQFESYLVASPKGTLTPRPMFHFGPRSMAKKKLGTSFASPASPPLPFSAGLLSAAGTLPLFSNLVLGAM